MANRTHILLLDHDEARRATASAILDFLDEPHVALAALSEAGGEPPQAVLLAADGEGFELEAVLEALAERDPGLPVVITAAPAGGVAAGRLEAPWGFVETAARLTLWLPAHPDPRARALADWLQAELHS